MPVHMIIYNHEDTDVWRRTICKKNTAYKNISYI